MALSKALEQATKQYQREKLWLQLAEDNIPKSALGSQCKSMLCFLYVKDISSN